MQFETWNSWLMNATMDTVAMQAIRQIPATNGNGTARTAQPIPQLIDPTMIAPSRMSLAALMH
jgi:hypothetical protein